VSTGAVQLSDDVVVRALRDGARGNQPVLAVIDLLHTTGLWARTDLLEAVVVLYPGRTWSGDLVVPALQDAAEGRLELWLTTAERDVLQLAVRLLAVGDQLQALHGPLRRAAIAAVLASVGHGSPGCSASMVLATAGVR
jgi:hypothetical protein